MPHIFKFYNGVYMQIYNIIAGVALLGFGRKLFWLFIGIAGFLFGMEITPMFFGDQPQWIQMAIAIGIGFFGAMLAMLAQRIAFTFGGFFAGMYLALRVSQYFAMDDFNTMLLLMIGAGIVCAVTATLIMDKAITILACLVGAGAIVGELHLGHAMNTIVFVILTGAGYFIQEKLLPASKKD